MAKFCSHCGKEPDENAVVCNHCGYAISAINTTEEKPKSQKQVSVVLGIIGIVFAWLFALIGHITSIIGIVKGIKEYKESNKMTGLVLSIIGEVCSIFSSIIGAATLLSMF